MTSVHERVQRLDVAGVAAHIEQRCNKTLVRKSFAELRQGRCIGRECDRRLLVVTQRWANELSQAEGTKLTGRDPRGKTLLRARQYGQARPQRVVGSGMSIVGG